ncbi:hypothetical protein RDI58_014846 [Solanum bulbocastanum]|uniref:Uncharacterized protein n=1 Tax=Solanum bulbocastanum TaxID=147425 RepID=A0AAN8TM60_SOLBU
MPRGQSSSNFERVIMYANVKRAIASSNAERVIIYNFQEGHYIFKHR